MFKISRSESIWILSGVFISIAAGLIALQYIDLLGTIPLMVGVFFIWGLIIALLKLNNVVGHLQELIAQHCATLSQEVEHRKNAELSANVLIESLEYAASFNHNIIQATHDALLVLSSEGEIKTINSAGLLLLGYEQSALTGQSIRQIIAQRDHDKLFAGRQLKKQLKEESIEGLPINYLSKSSIEIPMLFSSAVMRDGHGDVQGLVCTAMDQSERVGVEAALTQSKERLYAIINCTIDAIITIDEKGIIETFNLAAEQMFGYSAAQVCGHNITKLMPPADANSHDDYLKRYCETGDSEVIGIRREVEGKRKDDSLFTVELSINDIQLEGRRIFTGVLRNLKSTKEVEEEHYNLSKYLDTIFLNLPIGITILEGPEFRYFRINKTLADLNGYSIGAHLGKPLIELSPDSKNTLIPELTTVISSGLVALGIEELDQVIKQVLATIGTFCAVDKANLFELVEEEKCITHTHQWCAQDSGQKKVMLQSAILDEQLPWFAKLIRNKQIIDIPDVDQLPKEAEQERAYFQQQGIRSLLMVPMVVGSRTLGLIGFEAIEEQTQWAKSNLFVLRMVGEMLAHSLQHRQAE
jgi:PAS domain S-box-containing protein